MKHLKHLFIALLMLCTTMATAHDFKVDGIYYDITDATNKTVAVTYKGSWYDDYSDEYTGSVTIPQSVIYNGATYSVTSIGGSAFEGCSGLTSITIPNSVTSIGDEAFRNCTGLTSIEIPKSVTSIEYRAFDGCSGLTSITIPNSVTSIGNEAFSGCSGLTSITIPNSVTSIGNEAFWGCKGLKEVHTSDLAAWYGIDFGEFYANPLYYAHNLYLNGELVTDLVIPNSVTSIGNSAFSGCSGLTSVEIPNSVTSIGDDAFSGCSGLTSITIPNSVTSIGSSAFSGCSGLTSIVVDGNNTKYDSREDCNAIIETETNTLVSGCKNTIILNSITSIGNWAFSGCTGLTSITIPNSVTSIGDNAFSWCNGLTSVEIPNSVTSIGDEAFSGCTGLTSITIPNSVTSIGNEAFNGCTSLKELRIEDGEGTLSLGYNTYKYNNDGEGLFYDCALETLYLGRNLSYNTGSHCGYSPFYNIKTLASVTIGNSVTSIGSYAFYYCSGITSIEIGNSVTSIGSYAFYYCSGITSIEIGNSVTSIGSYAFFVCTSLKTVINFSNLTFSKGSSNNGYVASYADKVYNAPNGSFEGDFIFGKPNDVNTLVGYLGNATELTLPAGYNGENYAIGAAAFQNYTGLATELIIHNNITGIGASAFKGCNNIEKLYIGSSVESIGDMAFAGCEKITEIKVALEKPIRGSADIFTNAVYDNATLYIPNGTEQLYQKREPWNMFFYIVEIDFTGIEDVETEGERVQTIYDLQGRKVEVPSEGLYIINGKKVVVK